MNKAYQAMRAYWLDVKNLQHKQEVPQLGVCKVCIAGVEMAALDGQGAVKHILIAASSLGNASIYFENNSPSGLGGFTGGASSDIIHEKALKVLQKAAISTAHLLPVDELPSQDDPKQITLFTVSTDGQKRMTVLPEEQVRTQSHPLYAFFAYTQQLFSAFRAQQEAAQKAAAATAQANKE